MRPSPSSTRQPSPWVLGTYVYLWSLSQAIQFGGLQQGVDSLFDLFVVSYALPWFAAVLEQSYKVFAKSHSTDCKVFSFAVLTCAAW